MSGVQVLWADVRNAGECPLRERKVSQAGSSPLWLPSAAEAEDRGSEDAKDPADAAEDFRYAGAFFNLGGDHNAQGRHASVHSGADELLEILPGHGGYAVSGNLHGRSSGDGRSRWRRRLRGESRSRGRSGGRFRSGRSGGAIELGFFNLKVVFMTFAGIDVRDQPLRRGLHFRGNREKRYALIIGVLQGELFSGSLIQDSDRGVLGGRFFGELALHADLVGFHEGEDIDAVGETL